MRSAGVVLSLVLVVAVGAWWLAAPGTQESPSPSPASAGTEPLRRQEARDPVRLPAAVRVEVADEQVVAQADRSASPRRATADRGPGRIEGRVELRDEGGQLRPAPDGFLTVDAPGADLTPSHDLNEFMDFEVEVRAGRFALEAVGLTTLFVHQAFLDGRWTLMESALESFEVDEGPALLRCHWPEPAELRVVVVDETAHRHEFPDGSFLPQYWLGDEGLDNPRLEVVDGCVLVDRARDLDEIKDLVLDGRPAVVEGPVPVAVDEGVLNCRFLPATVLHVRDPEGRPLRDVVVLSAPFVFVDLVDRYSTDSDHTLARGHSPLTVDRPGRTAPVDEVEGVIIGAPGFAWSSCRLDFEKGGEIDVVLQRGAELLVRIHGSLGPRPEDPDRVPDLRLREAPAPMKDEPSLEDYLADWAATPDEAFPEGVRIREEELRRHYLRSREIHERFRGPLVRSADPQPGGEVLFTGLAPGDYVAAVEIGDEEFDPEVLGESTAPVVAGTRTTIDVHVRAPRPVPPPVPLAGTLSLCRHWLRQQPVLSIHPAEEWKFDPWVWLNREALEPTAQESTFRWDAGLVPPGRYRIEVKDIATFEVETGALGRRDLELRVGDPVRVQVRVWDDLSGEPISDLAFGCWPAGDSLEIGEEAGAYTLRAPAGPVFFWGHDHRYTMVDEDGFASSPSRQISATSSEVHLRVRRMSGIELHLQDPGRRPPQVHWSVFEDTRFERIDPGPGSVRPYRSGRYRASSPGRYRVHLPEIEGYEPVPPFEVVVPHRDFVEQNVVLRRR